MTLEKYNQKRDFVKTSEPKGTTVVAGKPRKHRFVIQEHHARRLHYDFRLEIEGVLKSWAVPKGPSLDPAMKRLAVLTEDHPVKYLTFQGSIPKGNYGAGEMAIWDTGTFETPDRSLLQQFESGKMSLILNGEKLQGAFTLIRLRDETQWLLLKSADEHAIPGWVLEPVLNKDGSFRNSEAKAPPTGQATKRNPAAAQSSVKHSRGRAVKSVVKAPLVLLPGMLKAPMPATIRPMLATPASQLPSGNWLYEIKWDGYRALSFINNGKSGLVSRNQISLDAKFPELAGELADLPLDSAIIDGEIVVLDAEGRPNFQLLQNRAGMYSKRRADKKRISSLENEPSSVAYYYAFDLLYLNGFDLKEVALLERKRLLQELLMSHNPAASLARFSDHVEGNVSGQQLLDHARELRLEGVIAKRTDSSYRERRTDNWQKIKFVQDIDVVIGGYTAPRKTRSHLGALVIGLYRDDKLDFVGHTGSGFNAETLRETFALLQPLRTTSCPFLTKPATNEPAVWVRPEVVCQVNFTEWTQDGSLRHPIFQGLRPDQEPRECVFKDAPATIAIEPSTSPSPATSTKAKKSTSRVSKTIATPPSSIEGVAEVEDVMAKKELKGNLRVSVGGHIVELTNLQKIYWPQAGYSKGDLIRYYFQIADVILPYLKDRPLILERFPNGIKAPSFHQHNIENVPEFLETFLHEEAGQAIRYALCNNLPSLLYIANLGTIAQHAWLSRVQQVTNPDWIVFDLDPGEVEYRAVCELAYELKSVLGDLGVESFAKTSGSSGMHICVAIQPKHTFDQLESFTALVAEIAQARRPDIATLERSLSKRPKKSIYLDHLQNREGKTVAVTWSPRAKPGATVSTPLTWAQVKRVPDPAAFSIATVHARLRKSGDLFQEALARPQDLNQVLTHIQMLSGERKVSKRSRRK